MRTCRTFLWQLENRLHQLRHGIVQIENDPGSEEFRDKGAENKDVRHVVHVDKVVFPLEGVERQVEKAGEEKSGVPHDVANFAGAKPFQRNAKDLDVAKVLARQLAVAVTQTKQIECDPFRGGASAARRGLGSAG